MHNLLSVVWKIHPSGHYSFIIIAVAVCLQQKFFSCLLKVAEIFHGFLLFPLSVYTSALNFAAGFYFKVQLTFLVCMSGTKGCDDMQYDALSQACHNFATDSIEKSVKMLISGISKSSTKCSFLFFCPMLMVIYSHSYFICERNQCQSLSRIALLYFT